MRCCGDPTLRAYCTSQNRVPSFFPPFVQHHAAPTPDSVLKSPPMFHVKQEPRPLIPRHLLTTHVHGVAIESASHPTLCRIEEPPVITDPPPTSAHNPSTKQPAAPGPRHVARPLSASRGFT